MRFHQASHQIYICLVKFLDKILLATQASKFIIYYSFFI